MSHFTKIKTEIKDIESLKFTVEQMGLGWKENANARGWQGNKQKADYVIVGDKNYDIAVVRNGKEESYSLIADWSMMNHSLKKAVGENANTLLQMYGLTLVTKLSKEQNMELSHEVLEDGTIRIVLVENEEQYVSQY